MAGTLVANTINTDTGIFTTNNAYLGIAKAWVNFAGSASPTINGSFNISSVTQSSTGFYVVNFTTAMANSTYAVVGSVSPNSGASQMVTTIFSVSGSNYQAPTTSSFAVETDVPPGTRATATANCYAVFSS